MGENDEVPDASKDDPGDDEGGGKAEQGPGPRQVDHRGEEVFEKSAKTSRQVLGFSQRDCTMVVFGNFTSITMRAPKKEDRQSTIISRNL